MFLIIIRGRNCRKYIQRCLRSLALQTVQDWHAILILDAPTDGVGKILPAIFEEFKIKDKIHTVLRSKRVGLSANLWHGITHVSPFTNSEPIDNDVLCILDADDWLSKKALRVVERAYQKHPDALLTYGSYKKISKGARTRISKAYRKHDNVRKAPWHGSHLKTFKWKLVKHLPQEVFLHKGKWIEAASDVALMLPLMEMAGLDRCVHIHRIIYYWRDNTPHKTDRKEQIRCEKIVRAKPKMKRQEI